MLLFECSVIPIPVNWQKFVIAAIFTKFSRNVGQDIDRKIILRTVKPTQPPRCVPDMPNAHIPTLGVAYHSFLSNTAAKKLMQGTSSTCSYGHLSYTYLFMYMHNAHTLLCSYVVLITLKLTPSPYCIFTAMFVVDVSVAHFPVCII